MQTLGICFACLVSSEQPILLGTAVLPEYPATAFNLLLLTLDTQKFTEILQESYRFWSVESEKLSEVKPTTREENNKGMRAIFDGIEAQIARIYGELRDKWSDVIGG